MRLRKVHNGGRRHWFSGVIFFSNFERIIKCQPKAVVVYKLKIIVLCKIIERFRFDYDYEIRHFWRQLLASSRSDVIKS